MQHVIICAQCHQTQFGTVEAAVNLELLCRRCKCTTIVNTCGDRITTRIGRIPNAMVERLMRSRYVDEKGCR